jgi:hypothetical protein
MATKPSPLTSFSPGSASNKFQLDQLPSLHEHVSSSGLMDGLKSFDAAMRDWKQNAEMNISEALNGKQG